MIVSNPRTPSFFNGLQTIQPKGSKSELQDTMNLQVASDYGSGQGSGQEAIYPLRGSLREGTTGKWFGVVSLLAALFASSAALADWNSQPEMIATHPISIYTTNSMLKGSNRRRLMVVLHGCGQTHDQIKNGGNLEKAAEDYGLVMAVPYVTKPDGYLVDCWDYSGTADNHGHVAEVIELTNNLKSRSDLKIDPNHVYVVGLSSGAALALKLGCKAPDVFAGIGAIAGPSVGSDQMHATDDRKQIPSTNVSNAITTCQSLADGKSTSFATQIANIAYGTMDRNGPQQIYSCWDQNHPGQNCVASIKWSEDNIEVLRKIYGTSKLGNSTSIQGGRGEEQIATAGGNTRLSLSVIRDVGHAWPAGTGKPNNADNGQYIAQRGLDYSHYITEWLTEHNIRAVLPVGPVVTVDKPSVSGKNLTLTGNVSGQDQIKEVDTTLLQRDGAGNFKQVATHKKVTSGAGDFTDTYTDLATGWYEMTATAMDVNNHSRSATTEEVMVGTPWECTQIYTSNYGHVKAGRAYDRAGNAYAKGSNDRMGLDNTHDKTTLAQTKKDYFIVGSCPSKVTLLSADNGLIIKWEHQS